MNTRRVEQELGASASLFRTSAADISGLEVDEGRDVLAAKSERWHVASIFPHATTVVARRSVPAPNHLRTR
jgi:hypothetical protein